MPVASRDDGFKAAVYALTGARCWRESEVPENAVAPFSALSVNEDASFNALGSATNLGVASYLLRLHGRTEAMVADMEQAIWDGMHHKTGVNSNAWWKASFVDNRGASVNFDDGGGLLAASRELTIRLFYNRS